MTVRLSQKFVALAALALTFIGVRTLMLVRSYHSHVNNNSNVIEAFPLSAAKQKRKNKKVSEEEKRIKRELATALINVKEIRDRLDEKQLFFETEKDAQESAKQLQNVTRRFLETQYGRTSRQHPYRVRLDLHFEPSMPDYRDKGERSSITIELAPVDLLPHSVHTFLEMVRSGCGGGEGDRFTFAHGHIILAECGDWSEKLYFQEYTPEYPHVQKTLGWAGRPSGPGFYFSIMDNSENHGPNSQGDPNPHQADVPIGKVVEGFEDVVLGRLTYVVTEKMAYIDKMTILTPDFPEGSSLAPSSPSADVVYREWSDED